MREPSSQPSYLEQAPLQVSPGQRMPMAKASVVSATASRNAKIADVELRQSTIFASLLRYAPETIPLRERVINRLVLSALVNSTVSSPYRIGAIQEAIKFGPNSPDLREEVLAEALKRLTTEGSVLEIPVRKKRAYYLSEAARTEVSQHLTSTADLFRPVLARMQRNADPSINPDISARVYRRFICESFANFGVHIAKNVMQQLRSEELPTCIDVEEAFKLAIRGERIVPEWIDTLKARCLGFLKSTEPEDAELKFYLTQGFYVAHLLGLERNGFTPLAEDAFSGSVFYLDSNVLLIGLLAPNNPVHLFEETLRVATRMGIQLRVTRATLDEVRRVAADKKNLLAKTIDRLPKELIDKSRDSVLQSFVARRENEPGLSVEEFFEPFERLSETLRDRWQIEVIEMDPDEVLEHACVTDFERTLQAQSFRLRKFVKPDSVLKHDLAHFVFIGSERAHTPKTWFLTHDRSMIAAGILSVNPGEKPFSFSMLGLLQSISPFITTDDEAHSFADVFNTLLTEQFRSADKLFDMRELALLSEMHQDVLSTPPDQLVLALDYVKAKVLQGKQYNQEDFPEVALELRKFLSCSADERRRALEEQLNDATDRARRFEIRACNAEGQLNSIQAQDDLHFEQLREAMNSNSTLLRQNTSLTEQVTKLEASNQDLCNKVDRLSSTVFWICCFVSPVVAALLWKLAPIVATVSASSPDLRLIVEKTTELVGLAIISVVAIWFVRRREWGENYKVGFVTAMIIVALKFSHFATIETLTSWQVYIDASAFFATVAILIFSRKNL